MAKSARRVGLRADEVEAALALWAALEAAIPSAGTNRLGRRSAEWGAGGCARRRSAARAAGRAGAPST